MIYIKKTTSVVACSSTKSIPKRYVFVRFISTFFAQLINIFPTQFQQLIPSLSWESHAIFYRFTVVSHLIGPLLDGLVLLFGNVEFTDFIHKKIFYFINKYIPGLKRIISVGEKRIKERELSSVSLGDVELIECAKAEEREKGRKERVGNIVTITLGEYIETEKMEEREAAPPINKAVCCFVGQLASLDVN